MPYSIFRKKDRWCVRNKDTGKDEGCSDTQEDAVSHMRVLYGVHDDWKPTGKKKKSK